MSIRFFHPASFVVVSALKTVLLLAANVTGRQSRGNRALVAWAVSVTGRMAGVCPSAASPGWPYGFLHFSRRSHSIPLQ